MGVSFYMLTVYDPFIMGYMGNNNDDCRSSLSDSLMSLYWII